MINFELYKQQIQPLTVLVFFNFEINTKLVVSISWLYKYIVLFKAVIGSSKSKEIKCTYILAAYNIQIGHWWKDWVAYASEM